ncbi:tyrosine-type recombinase/integrase [Luteibacter sp.]|jgi:integrase|uniref:tyrosine-type recombinase/integrase n=1 Tax=Luteibacter sp. TaxID=1886636 RepID=UPI002F420F8D
MLTDVKIRALKPRANIYRVADANGLCLEVRPSGSKLWRYRYRHAGNASMLPLGEYPATSLADARAERDKARALVRGGVNPANAVRAARAAKMESTANTFAAIAGEFLNKRSKEGMGAGSVARDMRMIEKDLIGLSHLPVTEITAPVLLAALRKLEQRGVLETAHRARGFAGRVFRYAIATGRAERDPSADLRGALVQPQTRHFASITDPARIGELLRAIEIYKGSPVTIAALKLAPLVFVRPGELRKARWADLNLDVSEWRYVASKTNTPHIVPLAHQAVAVLRDLQPLTGRSEFVFPSIRSLRRPMSENTVNSALRYMGFDGETMCGHGFRAMARTVLDEVLHFRPDYIEHQLAHAVRDPNGRAYNRTAHLPERRKMMQSWADYLDGLRLGAKVIPFERHSR